MKKTEFDFYKEWAGQQTCADCGAAASGRSQSKPWVTETQCMSCYIMHGSRGSHAADKFTLDMVQREN